ncbi:hypothetical protein Tco_1575043 [Tanacetum coccineum]
MQKEFPIFLAYVTAMEVEDKSEKKRLEDVPIVQDFPEVFPEDLPGSSDSTGKFQIDLVPGAVPVARAPYLLAPSEMKELSEQLKELSDKGFIRPSSSPWGAPVLFVKKKDVIIPGWCNDYAGIKQTDSERTVIPLRVIYDFILSASRVECLLEDRPKIRLSPTKGSRRRHSKDCLQTLTTMYEFSSYSRWFDQRTLPYSWIL